MASPNSLSLSLSRSIEVFAVPSRTPSEVQNVRKLGPFFMRSREQELKDVNSFGKPLASRMKMHAVCGKDLRVCKCRVRRRGGEMRSRRRRARVRPESLYLASRGGAGSEIAPASQHHPDPSFDSSHFKMYHVVQMGL